MKDWTVWTSVIAIVISVASIYVSYSNGRELQRDQQAFQRESARRDRIQSLRERFFPSFVQFSMINRGMQDSDNPQDDLNNLDAVYGETRTLYESNSHYLDETSRSRLDDIVSQIYELESEYRANQGSEQITSTIQRIYGLIVEFMRELQTTLDRERDITPTTP